jgi:hypothetical protein
VHEQEDHQKLRNLRNYHELLGDKRITQISVARDDLSFNMVIDVA